MSTSPFGNGSEEFTRVLAEARCGSMDVLGSLLETYRAYLTGLAKRLLPPDLQSKQSEEDLVQNVLAEALRQISTFNGTSPTRSVPGCVHFPSTISATSVAASERGKSGKTAAKPLSILSPRTSANT